MRSFRLGVVGLALAGGAVWGQVQDDGNGMPEGTHKVTAQMKLPAPRTAPNVPLNPRERALQMLNRFAYGPRPGDVEQVMAMGPNKWFEQQMMPGAIKDGAAEARLRDFPTLGLSAAGVVDIYPTDGFVRQVANGERPYPADPLLASLYEVQVLKYRRSVVDKNHPPVELTDDQKAVQKAADQATARRVAGVLFATPKKDRMAMLNAMPPEDRLAFAQNVPGDQRAALMADFSPREREVLSAMQGGSNVAYRAAEELSQAKIVRSIESERQVLEVMTDFWFNHFNVYQPKGADEWYTTAYERDTIRAHALGKFRDLLLATAEAPAMEIYLDNWLSVGPDSRANGVDPKNPNAKRGNKGLNENYGREVMELHTVGVGGGYTQADVTHLAAMLTGWGVDDEGHGGGFAFDAKKHEPGTKEWFGYTIDDAGQVVSGPAVPAGVAAVIAGEQAPDGMKQGVTALTLLAASPKTAHFISYLLAQRFVADEPPAGLVDRMTAVYLQSDGDVRAVLRTLVESPEFGSHRYYRNKVKTPFEFVVSAFRATATEPTNAAALSGTLDRNFGEALYKALPPTGYYITADHWMNTQSLLMRLNFADALTHGKLPGQKFDATRALAFGLMSDRGAAVLTPVAFAPGSGAGSGSGSPASEDVGQAVALRVLEGTLIGGPLSSTTERFVRGQMAAQPASNPTETLDLLTALLLGSPEFQQR